MKMPLYVLIVFCFISCSNEYPKYIEYTYEPKEQTKPVNVMNKISISFYLLPTGIEHRCHKYIASSPYQITLFMTNKNDIEIDDILLIINNNQISLFEGDFFIYDSSLERNYNEYEKTFFLSSRRIESRFSSRDWITIGFENVKINYKDVNSFEISMLFKIQDHDNIIIFGEAKNIFFRKKNSRSIIPTT